MNVTHVYTQAGQYVVTIGAISDLNSPPLVQGPPSCPAYFITVNGTLSSRPGNGVRVPVGQVAQLNALNYANVNPSSALLNYSWSSSTGSSYGMVGRIPSFKIRNESVSLTVRDPYATQNLQTSTYANFYDVKPTVSINSLYTEAQITVSIGNTYYAENVTIVLLENGKNVSWYNLWWYNQSVTFYPIDFQMADQWSLVENYTPYGSSGSSSVTTEFSWTACNSYGCSLIHNVYHTHTFYNNNPPSQRTDTISINYEALGQWAFATENLFSPAQTSFNETDKVGFGHWQNYTYQAPATAEPTLDIFYWEIQWSSGKNYTFNITACDAVGICGYMAMNIGDKYSFTVSDTAPEVQAPMQTPAVNAVPGTINTFRN